MAEEKKDDWENYMDFLSEEQAMQNASQPGGVAMKWPGPLGPIFFYS